MIQKHTQSVTDGGDGGSCSNNCFCDVRITSKDYKRLALFPGANGVVSFVYFQRENIIERENFQKV